MTTPIQHAHRIAMVKIGDVVQLHRATRNNICRECGNPHPCETVQILTGKKHDHGPNIKIWKEG
jgi:hypothetical protein